MHEKGYDELRLVVARSYVEARLPILGRCVQICALSEEVRDHFLVAVGRRLVERRAPVDVRNVYVQAAAEELPHCAPVVGRGREVEEGDALRVLVVDVSAMVQQSADGVASPREAARGREILLQEEEELEGGARCAARPQVRGERCNLPPNLLVLVLLVAHILCLREELPYRAGGNPDSHV